MQKSCGIFLYSSASFLAFVVAGGMGTGKRGDALDFKAPVLPLWPQRCSAPLQGALRRQHPAPRGLGDRGRSRGWLPQRPGSVLLEGNCRAGCDAQMRWTQDSAPCVQHRQLSASQRGLFPGLLQEPRHGTGDTTQARLFAAQRACAELALVPPVVSDTRAYAGWL